MWFDEDEKEFRGDGAGEGPGTPRGPGLLPSMLPVNGTRAVSPLRCWRCASAMMRARSPSAMLPVNNNDDNNDDNDDKNNMINNNIK